ncbi:MAG: hypothetical protein WD225_08230 [Ilumatobacteraceae bacterium]
MSRADETPGVTSTTPQDRRRRWRTAAAALVLVLAGPVVVAAEPTPSLEQPAIAAATAERDVAWNSTATCDVDTTEALAARHPEVRQFVLVLTDGWADSHATVEVAVRDAGGTWRCQRAAMAGRVGRAGTRPLAERRSGDGTAPAGVFPLGSTTAWDGQQFEFFGNRSDPGVRGRYRDVQPEDCWGATPHDPDYQKLVDRPGCPGPDDEWLPRFGDVYSHAAVIGANLDPVSGDAPGEPALAAAIFLHRHSYDGPDDDGSGASRPTSGCVSLAMGDLVATLRLIDPALNPHFAIGPVDWLRSEE